MNKFRLFLKYKDFKPKNLNDFPFPSNLEIMSTDRNKLFENISPFWE